MPDREPRNGITPLRASGIPFVTMALSVALVVAILYFAEAVFMPLALAALLSFLLTPAVQWLERHGLHRVFAVLVTTLASFALITGLFYVVANQFFGLVRDLPQYKDNLVAKIRPLQKPLGGRLDETTETIKELSDELNKNQGKPAKPAAPRIPKVEVVQPPPTPMQVVRNVFGPIMGPLGTGAVVILFVVFMLLERESLRDRLIRLTGGRDLQRTTKALDEATHRITRYLGMQLLINGAQGAVAAIGLYLIGVPSAILWGALTIVLRFIPYLGPWIAALMPIALSVAVFEGWREPLMVVSLIVTLELLSNNVLEPWLYGHQTGVSPLALLVAAVFWTWLWGTPGLFLAIPLTVSLVVMGKYVPQLQFFSVLLGDGPVLEPHERFYQRLLAREPEDAEQVIEETGEGRTPVEMFDAVLVPAIGLAQQDSSRGSLEDEQLGYILSHVGEASEALCKPKEDATKAPPAAGVPVLCLAADGEADELGAVMFARLLELSGFAARVLPANAFKGEYIQAIEDLKPACVCVVAFPPAAATHASYVCKLVRSRFDDLPLVVGLWSARGNVQKMEERLLAAGAHRVVDSFTAGVIEIGRLLQPARHLPAAAHG